ncbi:chemotaxis protein CheW [Herbaspirillum chlorophenolicum]|uniref:Chemotaxis protein CheW n=1 Tax=Herbaspirillum chlorophenolicum TaxID=211589 RepID=A0ABW8EZ72_9BURK|nr:chemotaxis protein CheW [Herbaspirillum chlorophenolicum]
MDENKLSGALSAEAIDDCWNSIGVRGDSSCPELKEHLRCLNCPTYARAALLLLDRAAQTTDLAQGWAQSAEDAARKAELASAAEAGRRRESALVFRVGEEWLALSTDAVIEVADARVVHSLPHQRNRAVQGVLNIRGALRICVSLMGLFQIADGHSDKRGRKHMIVVEHEGQTLVFPVDEVAGVHRYASDGVAPVPTTLAHAATQYTRGLLDWREHKVGLLDHGLLFYALNRSMA